MAKLFGNNQAPAALSPRRALEMKYNTARYNLLLAIIFTLINLGLLLFGDGTYFLFSVYFPYVLVVIGADWCGFFDAEYYDAVYGVDGWDPSAFYPSEVLYVLIAIALIVLAIYALFFFMSRKNKSGWLIAALVLFSIDTVFLLSMSDILSSLLDLVFHAWVIYYLVVGIRTANQLKALPEEEPVDMTGATVPGDISSGFEAAPAEAAEAPAEATEAPAQESNVWDEIQKNNDEQQ